MPSQRPEVEAHRAEIEQRTHEGANCEQIARELTAKGFEVSAKSISRYRLQWGLRKRRAGTVGRTYPDRKPAGPRRPTRSADPHKHRKQLARKADITARFERGESAEQIAAALEAQGTTFKAGASSVWRLLTLWRLVPYDADRARGKGKYDKKKQAEKEVRSTTNRPSGQPIPSRKRKRDVPAPTEKNGQFVHYPAGLANGPQKRSVVSATAPLDVLDPSLSEEPLLPTAGGDDDYEVPTAAPHVSNSSSVDTAAKLMSTEFLIDLATSTLTAAHWVKELYLSQQAHRPAPGQAHGRPPTDEDINAAKLKVREAAAVMYDLALPSS